MPDKLGGENPFAVTEEIADADVHAEQERLMEIYEHANTAFMHAIGRFGLGYGDSGELHAMSQAYVTAREKAKAKEAVTEDIFNATALAMRRLAERGYFPEISNLLEVAPCREEDLRIPEVEQWAEKEILQSLIDVRRDDADKLMRVFRISAETKGRLVMDAMSTFLRQGRVEDAKSVYRVIHTSKDGSILGLPEVGSAAQEGMLTQLREGNIGLAEKIYHTVGYPVDFKTPEAQAAGEAGIAVALSKGRVHDVFRIGEFTGVSREEITQSPENREVVWKYIFNRLAEHQSGDSSFDHAIDIAKDFALPDRPHTTEESAAVVATIAGRMGPTKGHRFEGAVELFHATDAEIEAATQNAFLYFVHSGSVDDIATFRKTYDVTDSIMGEPDVQEAAKQGFSNALLAGDIGKASQMLRQFALPREECRAVATKYFGIFLEKGDVQRCIQLKNSFYLPGKLFTDPEMAVAASRGMYNALRFGRDEDAYEIQDLCAIQEKDVSTVATKSLAAVLSEGQYMDRAKAIVYMFHPELKNITVDCVPLKMLLGMSDQPGFEALYTQDPWHDGVAAMLKVQARSAKAEHDPWLTDMVPLVEKLLWNNVIAREKPEDVEVLLDYVKMFGMYNLPQMAEAFIALKRGTEFGKLPVAMQEQLRAIVGKKVDRLDGEQIINELRRFRRDMQSTLLADEIPDGIDTEIGTEIFAGLKGETKWGRATPSQVVVGMWRATVERMPNAAKLPEGYREHSARVPLIDRREKVEKPDEVKERKERAAKLLTRGTAEKPTELGTCFALFESAAAELGDKVDRKAWWEGKRAELAQTLAFDDSGMEKALAERETQLKEKNNPPERIAKILDGVRAGYAKKRAEAAVLQDTLRGLEYPDGSDDAAFVVFLESLSGLRRETAVKQTLLALSAEHIRRIAPEWGARLDGALKNTGGAITAERVTGLHDVYTQYINEHYFGGEDEHHTGHTPFSPGLHDALTWAYGVPKDMDGHVLSKTRAALDALEKGDVTVSDESMTVTLVPTQGLLRVYSGTVADACYTSQERALADGEVPDLHAVMFVTNRSTAQERLQGSVLFVETRTPDGENVLLVRANNPRENLINQVDAEVLVKATIDAAIATAKARGIKIVVVPLDAASASCSNRSAVAEYYKKHYATAKKIALVNEGETNFNGYNNWDANGTHPSVVVWRV